MSETLLHAHARHTSPAPSGRRTAAIALTIAAALGGTLAGVAWGPSPAGAAQAHNPIGHVDAVRQHADRTVTVLGWEFDPDSPRGSVRVSVDGRTSTVATDHRHPNVNRHFAKAPRLTGFTVTTGSLSYGRHRICVTGVNRGPGASTPLGCSTVTVVDPHNPRGAAALRVRGRTVTVRGNAVDPDAPVTAIRLQYVVDGRVRATAWTAAERGSFTRSLTLPYGTHTIAVRAFNVGAGSGNPLVASRRVTLAPPLPPANRAVARFAAAQVGKGYSSGGVGPNAYDCSGLALAAYARAGLNIPHSAQAQYGMFRRISASRAEPGDLVFFHSPGGGAVYHVAVVAPGHNMMYSAADYGTGVVHKENKYAEGSYSSSGYPTSPGSAVVVTYGSLTHA